MADTFTKKRTDGKLRIAANTLLIEAGDLLYYDATANDVKPASAQADQSSEAANQVLFATNFVGVAMDRSPAGTTDDISVDCDNLAEFEYPCDSATWDVGNLVAAQEDSGGTFLEDQKLVLTAVSAEAIGVCVKTEASATTTVRARLFSKLVGHRVAGS